MQSSHLVAPERYNMVQEIEKFAQEPDKLALIWENEAGDTKELTYQELLQGTNQIANVLKEHGLKKGDPVLVMVPRLVEAYQIYLAALKLGLVITPSSEQLRASDIAYRINHGGSRAVIVYEPYADTFDQVDEVAALQKFVVGGSKPGWLDLGALSKAASTECAMEDTSRDDMAFLSYTSGTTGNPKGVVHTHGWAFAHLQLAGQNWLGIKEGDRVWATAGPGWQKWVWSPFMATLGLGATGFSYYGKFEPERYLQNLEKHNINVLCCTPTEYRLISILDNLDQFDLSALRSAVSAGEPLNREVIDTFKDTFNITVRDGYGQTENTLIVGVKEGMEVRPGSMGKPTMEGFIDIVDDEGKPVAAGEVGDIAVRRDTPALFKEYYKDPERTELQYRGDYYITGDRAMKDEDGYFWFEGRSDDIIVSSGYTIGPFEVEDALLKHPAVQECAVVASPDKIRGNVVKAFIILRDKALKPTEELVKEIQDHVKTLTAPYKYPRLVEFVETLPKTISGKIRRVELRDQDK